MYVGAMLSYPGGFLEYSGTEDVVVYIGYGAEHAAPGKRCGRKAFGMSLE